MRFQPIASGSSGNCCYIGSDHTHLLVDVGISCKRTKDALKNLGLTLQDIDAICITHEHSDHIQGLAMIAKQTEMPIYATEATIRAIRRSPKGDLIDPERFVPVRADNPFPVADLSVNPMTISHDAADPVAYRVYADGKKACVCTDIGCFTDYTVECLCDADVLLLEANHDVNMLQVGPYPYRLKQRILSDHGHLSNLSSGELLTKVINDHLAGVFLGHLSQENNYPELAFETVRVELMSAEAECMERMNVRPLDIPLAVAARDKPSALVEV